MGPRKSANMSTSLGLRNTTTSYAEAKMHPQESTTDRSLASASSACGRLIAMANNVAPSASNEDCQEENRSSSSSRLEGSMGEFVCSKLQTLRSKHRGASVAEFRVHRRRAWSFFCSCSHHLIHSQCPQLRTGEKRRKNNTQFLPKGGQTLALILALLVLNLVGQSLGQAAGARKSGSFKKQRSISTGKYHVMLFVSLFTRSIDYI